MMKSYSCLFAFCLAVVAWGAPRKMDDGLLFDLGSSKLKVGVYADNIIRVTVSASEEAGVRPSLAALPAKAVPAWSWKEAGDEVVLSTKSLNVHVEQRTGRIRYFDADGRPILSECSGVERLVPAEVQGEKTFHVAQSWEPHDDESFFGLGQNQYGIVDVKGFDITLWQRNTVIGIPFVMSSRGYGLLWDNTSETRWGDKRPFGPLALDMIQDKDGKPGAWTASYFADRDFNRLVDTRRDGQIHIRLPDRNNGLNAGLNPALPEGEASIRWEGTLVPDRSGVYQLSAYFDGDFKLWIDGKELINHWRQDWLATDDLVKIDLEAGRRYAVRMEWIRDRNSTSLVLKWKPPTGEPVTSLWSEVGDGVDYYFIHGPDLRHVIAGYRTITGRATLLPRWAFGFWQSRERYETQQQGLDVVKEYRRRGIPFDNIVQDWQYWRIDQWGSHEFDPQRFPDPAGWVKAIHDQHAQLMISVWGKFYAGTDNYQQMLRAGHLYEPNIREKAVDFLGYPFAFVDAFSPAARSMFWDMMKQRLLPLRIDAWWMDASEPDLTMRPDIEEQKTHIHPNHLGTGSRMLLAYPLMLAKAVYDGHRQELPDQRVFNLTRSGFLGLQRFGAVSWSGDITSTWTAMKKQIAAGVSYAASGLPYWTMDAGGFSVPARFDPAVTTNPDFEEWCELNARWFEFAAFVPIFRAHGQRPHREMWSFGDKGAPAYEAMVQADRVRYRLLPYIYSIAGAVSHEGAGMMYPLGCYFPTDAKARSLNDAYLFGPAFLVNPITGYKERSRDVYLPETRGGWYDFWTGRWHAGGQSIRADAPYDRIPVMVRAGSIVPVGPEIHYAMEKTSAPVTIMVYAGADGDFTLYEDDGLTYDYEKGDCARIRFQWDDATRTLTIGEREGRYPGMAEKRKVRIMVVDTSHPSGFSFEPRTDRELIYDGSLTTTKL